MTTSRGRRIVPIVNPKQITPPLTPIPGVVLMQATAATTRRIPLVPPRGLLLLIPPPRGTIKGQMRHRTRKPNIHIRLHLTPIIPESIIHQPRRGRHHHPIPSPHLHPRGGHPTPPPRELHNHYRTRIIPTTQPHISCIIRIRHRRITIILICHHHGGTGPLRIHTP